MPVGRPQTVVVDLTGKLPPGAAALRLVTTMRVYWDEAAVGRTGIGRRSSSRSARPARPTSAGRGFSAEASRTGASRRLYDYARASPALAPWKTMPGRYTREGDVRPLLHAVDDVFVVARPGDEVALIVRRGRARRAAARVALAPSCCYGDGFSKEMDINSASPDVVQPLPFHGMTAYPYVAADVPPAVKRAFEAGEAWNTRVVLRPVVPIERYAAGRPDGGRP